MIPPTKLYVRGKVNPEIERFIAANSRIPVETLGDLRGQVAACRVGAQRMQELCARFGVDTVRDGCGELMARVAGQLRDALAAMPDGKHEAEGLLDHDGIGYDRPRRIHVAVKKKGRAILFDFSGSDDQARGPVNVTSALIKNTCYFGLMAMTDASLPFNHGFVDVVQTKFKEGTIVCPRPGAPVSYYVPLAYLTADVVLHALGKFNPERAVGSSGGGGGVRITSAGGKSGKPWVFMELLDTALGASSKQDGVSLIHGTSGSVNSVPGPSRFTKPNSPCVSFVSTSAPIPAVRANFAADLDARGSINYWKTPPSACAARATCGANFRRGAYSAAKAARTGFYASMAKSFPKPCVKRRSSPVIPCRST